MMNFSAPLQTLLHGVDGPGLAILLGLDGIPVAYETQGDLGPRHGEELVVELSRLIKQSMEMAQVSDLGALEELTLVTRNFNVIMQIVNAEYFLVFVVGRKALLGESRYRLQQVLTEVATLL